MTPALRWVTRWPTLAIVIGAMMLAGCASQQSTTGGSDAENAAWEERQVQLGRLAEWGFTGRLSVDDGADGGSGRLDWRAGPDKSTLQFRGALGQGAWQLEMKDDGAILRLADGSVHEGASVNELVQRKTDWRIPVDALAWWVRGLSDGQPDPLELDEQGRPVMLVEQGWTIQYTRYDNFAGVSLPTRLEATDNRVRVKLAISRWWQKPTED